MPRLVTLLPDPDSPTMPRVLPRSTVNDSPSTALTTPSSVGKWMRRSRTSRKADGGAAGAGCGSSAATSGSVALMVAPFARCALGVLDPRVHEPVDDVHDDIRD